MEGLKIPSVPLTQFGAKMLSARELLSIVMIRGSGVRVTKLHVIDKGGIHKSLFLKECLVRFPNASSAGS
jgi:hypothetical protein